jgi:hypothetical protein
METPVDAVRTDVIGVLTTAGRRANAIPAVARALADALHPSARVHSRRLHPLPRTAR